MTGDAVSRENDALDFNPEHIAILTSGVRRWNKWRRRNPETVPRFATTSLGSYDLRRSNLRDADLRQVDLSWADLTGADLRGADLRGADLTGARVVNADLSGARLQEAAVDRACFVGSRLTKLDLRSCKRISNTQLAGADLADVVLPEGLGDFTDVLAHTKDRAVTTRQLFLLVLVASVYTVFTILNTPDANLLTNTGSSRLPIVDVELGIGGFLWVTPFLLLAAFVFFHLNLQRLWESVADLPDVFPDGQTLEMKTYPWFMLGFVRRAFMGEGTPWAWAHRRWLFARKAPLERRPLSGLQTALAVVLGWFAVPITLGILMVAAPAFGVAQLPVLMMLVYWSVLGAFGFWDLFRRTLACPANQLAVRRHVDDHRLERLRQTGGLRYSLARLTSTHRDAEREPDDARRGEDPSRPRGSPWFRALVFVPAVAVIAPPGLDLRNADLRNADLSKKDFVSADLTNADLRRADLSRADLTMSTLTDADLRDADLTRANLSGADLTRADMRGADLFEADLTWANIYGLTVPSSWHAPDSYVCVANSGIPPWPSRLAVDTTSSGAVLVVVPDSVDVERSPALAECDLRRATDP